MNRLATAGVLVAGLLLPGATPVQAATGELSPVAARAFSELAGCAADADALLVSIVVDESGSLRSTDPQDRRVDGITTAIDTLAELRATARGSLDVQANLTTFAEGHQDLVGWGSVEGGHADRLRQAANGLAQRDSGDLTDYRQALRGAQEDLRSRAAAVTGSSCKVVLWFTDGRLDVGGATGTARTELCAPQGILDGIRSEDITVIALALFTESGSGSVSAEEREQLRAVAEGAGQGSTCGTTPIPADIAAGAYLRADDAGALRRLFAGAGALIAGGAPGPSAQCPTSGCPDGRFTFPVDAGIGGFRLVVDATDDASRPVLRAPSGVEQELSAGTRPIAGGTVSVTTRAGLTTASVAFEESTGPHVGNWVLQTRTAAQSKPSFVDLYYMWGAKVDAAAPEGLVVGAVSPLLVTLTGPGTGPTATSSYESVLVEASVGGRAVALQPAGDGSYRGEVNLTDERVPTSLPVTVSATARTRPSGVALAPIAANFDLATRLPPSYPTLSPPRLDLPALLGLRSTTGSLTVTGPAAGPTRACLAGSDLAAPGAAGEVQVEAGTPCVDVPPGEQVDWTFVLTPSDAADGRVSGELLVTLTPANGDQELAVAVPVEFTMSRPVDEVTRWLLVAGLVVASLVVPLALMAVANAWQGRYRLTTTTRSAVVPVYVTRGGLKRADDPAEPLIGPDDFHGLGIAVTARRASFTAHGVRFARRLPRWPLNKPTAYATGAPGEVMLSGHGSYTDRSGARAPVGFGFPLSWVLALDAATLEGDQPPAGRLVFVNDERGGELRQIIEHRTDQLTSFDDWETLLVRGREAVQGRAAEAVKSTPDEASTVSPTDADGPPPLDDGPPPLDDRPPSTANHRSSDTDPPPPLDSLDDAPPPALGNWSSSGGRHDDAPPPPRP